MARPKGIPSHNKGKILVPKQLIYCLNCGCKFNAYQSSKRKFCSHKCSSNFNIGKKSVAKSIGIKKAHKNKSFGYKPGENLREKNSSWKGGVTYKGRMIRKSRDYAKWRKAVLIRDDYTCRNCGAYKNVPIEVHHIYSFSKYPELRFDINNGKTLCQPCHKKTNSYGNYKGGKNEKK